METQSKTSRTEMPTLPPSADHVQSGTVDTYAAEWFALGIYGQITHQPLSKILEICAAQAVAS